MADRRVLKSSKGSLSLEHLLLLAGAAMVAAFGMTAFFETMNLYFQNFSEQQQTELP